MKNWKDTIYFILVEPREPGNIGASARAIKNMGFKHLCLVNPHSPINDEARWLAHNAVDILDAAVIYPTVRDAINNTSLVVGTTRRMGKRRGLIIPVEEGAHRILSLGGRNKIAILFGREDRGLFNHEVKECGFLMTIPSSKKQPSLNLAQAVLIIAYELSRAEYLPSNEQKPEKDVSPDAGIVPLSATRVPKMSTHRALTALHKRIEETLAILEYIPEGDRDISGKIMQNLKHLIGRAGLTEWEVKMLHGICSRIEKKIISDKD